MARSLNLPGFFLVFPNLSKSGQGSLERFAEHGVERFADNRCGNAAGSDLRATGVFHMLEAAAKKMID